MKQPNNYGIEFSNLYDELMTSSKYDKWNDLIKEQVKKYSIKGNAIDLACGTGTISKMLLELDFNVVGVDKSKYMINLAKEKLKAYNDKINFVISDLRTFNIPKKFDLAVSFYDSLNYLLSIDDLKKVFKKVYDHLNKGAYFIFDMNTKEHVSVSSNAPQRIFNIGRNNITFNFSGEENIWCLDIILKKGEKEIKEKHVERGYSSSEIESIVNDIGFEVLEIIDESKIYWDEQKHLSRQYYILRKSL